MPLRLVAFVFLCSAVLWVAYQGEPVEAVVETALESSVTAEPLEIKKELSYGTPEGDLVDRIDVKAGEAAGLDPDVLLSAYDEQLRMDSVAAAAPTFAEAHAALRDRTDRLVGRPRDRVIFEQLAAIAYLKRFNRAPEPLAPDAFEGAAYHLARLAANGSPQAPLVRPALERMHDFWTEEQRRGVARAVGAAAQRMLDPDSRYSCRPCKENARKHFPRLYEAHVRFDGWVRDDAEALLGL